jgi:hypothetical protein
MSLRKSFKLDSFKAFLLKSFNALIFVLLAEDRDVHLRLRVTKFFCHFFPFLNQVCPCSTPDMVGPGAVEVLALDARTSLSHALAALDCHSIFVDLAAQSLLVVVEPDLRNPVYTNNVGPLCHTALNWFHNAL